MVTRSAGTESTTSRTTTPTARSIGRGAAPPSPHRVRWGHARCWRNAGASSPPTRRLRVVLRERLVLALTCAHWSGSGRDAHLRPGRLSEPCAPRVPARFRASRPAAAARGTGVSRTVARVLALETASRPVAPRPSGPAPRVRRRPMRPNSLGCAVGSRIVVFAGSVTVPPRPLRPPFGSSQRPAHTGARSASA
jgi:hypothetical protein